ncbi:MAG TPA: DUF1963 domain-containing protein [Thermomicrobiales bacterium]|jgi:hypothetical protein
MDVGAILAAPELARVADDLAALVRPSIRLTATAADEGALVPHASKFGGQPALPEGVAWPTARLRVPPPSAAFRAAYPDLPLLSPPGIIALPFIAQLWLNDVAPYDAEGLLPPTGLLSFFYNPVAFYSDSGDASIVHGRLTGQAYGVYDYDSPANWRVLYHDLAPARFALATPPPELPLPTRYPAQTLAFAAEPTLPQVETCFIGEHGSAAGVVALTPDEWDAYAELRHEARANDTIHQLLGHPDGPQPFTLERGYCAVRAAFFPELPPRDTQTPAAQEVELVANRLLLQVDVLPSGARFGREGRLFFGIRGADLARRAFDKVWVAAP